MMRTALQNPLPLRMTWEPDSLDLFELVMALEEKYEIEIPSEELTELTTVGSVMEYLKGKGVED